MTSSNASRAEANADTGGQVRVGRRGRAPVEPPKTPDGVLVVWRLGVPHPEPRTLQPHKSLTMKMMCNILEATS